MPAPDVQAGVAAATAEAPSGPPIRPTGSQMWTGVALTVNQLALMAANLLVSLLLAYAGGVWAVGAVAPGVLVLQFGAGVLQQVIGEASLLAESGSNRRVALDICRWAVGAALLGGLVGGVIACGASAAVSGGSVLLGAIYAVGVPAAHVLDIGRAAAVAHHQARSAALEAVAWALALTAATTVASLAHSPVWVCAAWAIVNWAFVLASAVFSAPRRPAVRGTWRWLMGQRGFVGPASADAVLTGLTPLLATQAAALTTSAATIGAVRIVQQLFAPLAFVSISVRKFLIFKRSPEEAAGGSRALRDGFIAAALVSVGAVLIGASLAGADRVFASLTFLPTGSVLILAGLEKATQGLAYGASLDRFVRRDFRPLLRARQAFLAVSLVAAPLGAYLWDAQGFLLGTSAAWVVFSLLTLVLPHHASVSVPRQV